MDRFIDALLSAKTDKIPDEYDWFAPLLGDWDCDYYDELNGQKRYVKGEWIFRRVLEGAGIQDIFIFPSRATKEQQPQPEWDWCVWHWFCICPFCAGSRESGDASADSFCTLDGISVTPVYPTEYMAKNFTSFPGQNGRICLEGDNPEI